MRDPTERAAWGALVAESDARALARRNQALNALRSEGLDAAALGDTCFGEERCQLIASVANRGTALRRWAEFLVALEEARAPFTAYRAALRAVEERLATVSPETAPLAEQLKHWTVPDQVWRKLPPAHSGGLSPAAMEMVSLLGDLQLIVVDQMNLRRMKEVVQTSGWPTISAVGREASDSAWLLVQHADEDPLFQLRVLNLMGPLVERGEVMPRNRAYLHDRIMLKLAGKQRYGTQMWCSGGRVVPRPLEQPARLEALRIEAGLESMTDTARRFPPSC